MFNEKPAIVESSEIEFYRLLRGLPKELSSKWQASFDDCEDDESTILLLTKLQKFCNERIQASTARPELERSLSSEQKVEISGLFNELTSCIEDENTFLGKGAVGCVHESAIFPNICVKFIYHKERHHQKILLGDTLTMRQEFDITIDAFVATKALPVRAIEPLSYLPNNQQMYAMEKVRGITLEKIINDPESFPQLKELKEMDHQKIENDLLKSLATLHAANIVHRDLAARNIMIDGDLKFYFIDFGRAKRLEIGELEVMRHDEYMELDRQTLKLTIKELFKALSNHV